MIAKRITEKLSFDYLSQVVVIFMICTFGWAWECFNHEGLYMRIGRAKVFLISAVAIASFKLVKSWHWSIGMLYLYVTGLFIYQLFPVHAMVDIVCISAVLFLIPEIFKRIDLKTFENAILVTALIHCIFGVFNYFGKYPLLPATNIWYAPTKPIIGLMGQHTLLAPFLVFAFSIALNRFIESQEKLHRLIYSSSCAASFAIIILAKSSMGFISLLGALIAFAVFYLSPLAVATFLSLILLFGLLAIHMNHELASFSGRLEPWRDAWSILNGRSIIVDAKEWKWEFHPWLGMGTGSWSVIADQLHSIRKYDLSWTQLHNEFLQGLVEWGRIGMSLVCYFIFRVTAVIPMLFIFRRSEALPYVAGFVAFLLNSSGNYTMHVFPHGALAMIFCYVILGKVGQDAQLG